MANIKLVGNNWEAEGIFDKTQNKTQKAINSEVVSKLNGIEAGAQVNRTYTATTGKPTANQTPLFGGTATVSQVAQDATGQISVTDRTIKIPNSTASTSAAGLMSAADKTALDTAVTNIGTMSEMGTAATTLAGGIGELKNALTALASATTLASGTDFNTLISDHVYLIGNVAIYTNSPSRSLVGLSGYLYVRKPSTYILQYFFGNVAQAYRISYDGANTWNDWIYLSTSCLQAAVKTISGNGTSSNTLTGLTADHVVGNWGMFSDAACTTPIPENSPTCNITITTATNAWSVTIENFSSTFYIRPTFILKQN